MAAADRRARQPVQLVGVARAALLEDLEASTK